jgi:hypothetical protein
MAISSTISPKCLASNAAIHGGHQTTGMHYASVVAGIVKQMDTMMTHNLYQSTRRSGQHTAHPSNQESPHHGRTRRVHHPLPKESNVPCKYHTNHDEARQQMCNPHCPHQTLLRWETIESGQSRYHECSLNIHTTTDSTTLYCN